MHFWSANVTCEHSRMYFIVYSVIVVIAEPPRVLTPNNQVYQVIMNKPALLDCAFFGSPIPEVTWYVCVYVYVHLFVRPSVYKYVLTSMSAH